MRGTHERSDRQKVVQKLIDDFYDPEDAKGITIQAYRDVANLFQYPIKENPSEDDIAKHMKKCKNSFNINVWLFWVRFLERAKECPEGETIELLLDELKMVAIIADSEQKGGSSLPFHFLEAIRDSTRGVNNG